MKKLKTGNYWIKTKSYLPWEIARHDSCGTWHTFAGPQTPELVGEFIPQKDDYEDEGMSLTTYMAIGFGSGLLSYGLMELLPQWLRARRRAKEAVRKEEELRYGIRPDPVDHCADECPCGACPTDKEEKDWDKRN